MVFLVAVRFAFMKRDPGGYVQGRGEVSGSARARIASSLSWHWFCGSFSIYAWYGEKENPIR